MEVRQEGNGHSQVIYPDKLSDSHKKYHTRVVWGAVIAGSPFWFRKII